jgi:DNA polymerase-3 subunit delta'
MQVDAQELGPVRGHDAAKREFLSGVQSGRLHHGWLLRGPRGVGKARLALQFAMHLLSGDNASLSANDASAVGRLVTAGSHPDLRVIRRPVDDNGKQKSEIPVESLRALSDFFALRPALGGWRVAIIDAVDELNRHGANAILKTLEEPPARAVLFLISHGERLLLPTIRSRCHAVRCGPLTEADTLSALMMAGHEAAEAEKLARLAPGRPGRAMDLKGDDAANAADAIAAALRNLGEADARSLQAALASASKSESATAAALETLRLQLQMRAQRETDPVAAGQWADAAMQVMRLESEADALNQDRMQTVAAALSVASPLVRTRS